MEEDKTITSQEETTPKKATVRPKIFSSPNERIEIVVKAYYNNETGEFEFAVPKTAAQDEDEDDQETSDHYIVMEHKFYFSNVPYNRLNIYRTRAGRYNERDKTTTLDFIRLRDFLWAFHLKDWNMEDEDGNKIELTHDPDGTLSEESNEKLWQIPSVILDLAISLFENKIHII